jgi:hypothetical protein
LASSAATSIARHAPLDPSVATMMFVMREFLAALLSVIGADQSGFGMGELACLAFDVAA